MKKILIATVVALSLVGVSATSAEAARKDRVHLRAFCQSTDTGALYLRVVNRTNKRLGYTFDGTGDSYNGSDGYPFTLDPHAVQLIRTPLAYAEDTISLVATNQYGEWTNASHHTTVHVKHRRRGDRYARECGDGYS